MQSLDKNNENYFSENLNRDELKSVLEKETKEVDKEEMDALKSILELKDLTVEDILIPINEVLKIEIGNKSQDVPNDKDIFLPVVKRNSDEILGFIHSKEIEQFNDFSGDNIDFLIEPYYVPEKTHLFSQLKNFQKNGKEVALVVDEYGGTSGMVTLEDILEEIVGEIEDETDIDEEKQILQVSDNEYLVPALTELEDFNDQFNTEFIADDFDTIGGIVLREFARFPALNESVDINGYKFTVVSASRRQIKKLRVKVTE